MGALQDGHRLTFCESKDDSSCQASTVNSTISMNSKSRIRLTSFIGSEATRLNGPRDISDWPDEAMVTVGLDDEAEDEAAAAASSLSPLVSFWTGLNVGISGRLNG